MSTVVSLRSEACTEENEQQQLEQKTEGMVIKLVNVVKCNGRNHAYGRRFAAVYELRGPNGSISKLMCYFGICGIVTYIDGCPLVSRTKYLLSLPAFDENNPLNCLTLEKEILYGDHREIEKNIAAFKRKFHV